MKILACYNIKGGVGKTTSAVNLAYLCAQKGWRTALWDLDSQGAASFYFRLENNAELNEANTTNNSNQLIDHLVGTNYPGLDLVPVEFANQHLESFLIDNNKNTNHLADLLRPLADEYDYVFLDCAPGISLVTENIFNTADALLVPMIPTTLSLRTLKQLVDSINNEEQYSPRILPFFSLVDRRRLLHRTILDNPPFKGQLMMESWIPYASVVEKMGLRQAPLPAYARYSNAAQAYMSLWDEIGENLSLG